MKRSILSLCTLLLLSLTHLSAQTTSCQTTNIAAGRPVASSRYTDGATSAVDGNVSTIWDPQIDGDQWIYVDLGQNYSLCKVVLLWNAWHEQDTFRVQFSTDTSHWTDLAYNTTAAVAGPSGTSYQSTTVDLSASTMSGRYLRIYLYNIEGWNIQMEELQVYNKIPVNLPVVSLTAPSDGANYTEGDSVVLQATASETSGTISQIQFYQGTTLIGSSSISPYKYTWKNVPEGEYTVTAKAIDANGYSTASAPISVYVDYPAPGWSITGNSGTNADSNFVGTIDSTKLVFRTNKLKRMTILPNGNIGIGLDTPVVRFQIGGTVNDPVKRPAFMVYPNGDFAASTTMDRSVTTTDQNGIRYYSKLGLLQLGASDVIDTTQPRIINGKYEGTGILMNSDDPNTIKGSLYSAILAGNVNRVDSGVQIWDSYVGGDDNHFGVSVGRSLIMGYGHGLTAAGGINNSIVSGYNNQLVQPNAALLVTGFVNVEADSARFSLVNGWNNTYGGVGQLVSGERLINRSPEGTTLGSSNVDFSTLNYTGWKGLQNIPNAGQYPLFVLGNGNNDSGTVRSNAMTVLFNGRTQINTTGFSTPLTQTAATPKAAFEVVSTNSGVLLPKLTTAQRNAIVSGDLQNGLLLYNTDSTQFQFYNGSGWAGIGSGGSNSVGWGFNGNAGTSASSNFIGTTDNQPLIFKANGTRGMTLLTNGAVVIGDSALPSSGALFAVNGSAYAKKVVVTQIGWPDYVFDKSYHLPNLSEVELYISRHQHLPGVTSAGDITKNGLDLGAGQAELLKKVEELTLYLIDEHKKQEEQDKELEALKDQNHQLAEKNRQLQEQNTHLDNLQQQIDELKKMIQSKNQ